MKQDEYIANLNRIWNENSGLAGFRYFCDLTYEWYPRIWDHSECPRIIVLGTGIPDELVRAFDVSVMRILGGNHESCGWSDQLVPRDTDRTRKDRLRRRVYGAYLGLGLGGGDQCRLGQHLLPAKAA